MTDTDPYPVPAETVRVEQEIKRSRFIATVGRAEGADQAMAFINEVRAVYPDASHNCWAYVAGPPGNTLAIGMSDAGEPHGTAGRPMLNVLQHRGVGEIVAVVTRYFGGTKLGAGGLVRAYSGVVRQALEQLPQIDRIVLRKAQIMLPYAHENPARHLLDTMRLGIQQATYLDHVVLHVDVPSQDADALVERIRDLTQGAGTVRWVS